MGHKTKLNDKQVHLLKMMYKFRFVSSSVLAGYKGVRVSAINKSLNILVDHGYIARNYRKDYRILGKGASFYLKPKGLTYLRDNFKLNEKVLHAMYKNNSVGQAFIDHNLAVLSVYLALRNSYPDTFHIFTKTELADYNYFPVPLPDLYLNRIKPLSNNQNEFIVEVLTDSQFYVAKKRFACFLEHFDSGEWEAEVETSYPIILFVCPDSRIEKRLQNHIANVLDGAGIDDLGIYTTTNRALVGQKEANKAIWSSVYEPEKLISL